MLPTGGDPQTPPNLHPNPPPPKHKARVMPRKRLQQNTSNTNNPAPVPGAMGPPALPVKALQPGTFREDKIQDMMEDPDHEVQRKGQEALNTKYLEHFPKVIAASQRFQSMLDVQNPTEWPLPTVRDDVSEAACLLGFNVTTLHAALDDCKKFCLPMDRSSEKGELLDELHVRLHKYSVGIGGSSFSANAYPTLDAQVPKAVKSAGNLLRTATANAASHQTQKSKTQTTAVGNSGNHPILQKPEATRNLEGLSPSPQMNESLSPDSVLEAQKSPVSDGSQPATPPGGYWRGIDPDYTGTSVDAFCNEGNRKATGPLSPSLTMPEPIWTASSDSVTEVPTAAQIACQRHENYDANCLGCTRDAMHGLPDTLPENVGNDLPVVQDGGESTSEWSPGSVITDNSPFTGVELPREDSCDDTSGENSPGPDVATPDSASQSTDSMISEATPSVDTELRHETSPMASELSNVPQVRTILPIMQKSSFGNVAFSPEAPSTKPEPPDVVSSTTATVLVDPAIDQSEAKNKGKAKSMGTEPTQQYVSVSGDRFKSTISTGSVKKGRNPPVPDPNHPGLKNTLTERMLNWDQFGSKACLTLTLEDTSFETTSPQTPQIVLLHHFEVGLDGVEAIVRGQFDVAQTPEVKADRDARLGILGTRKSGAGGTYGALKHNQVDSWYGQGIWVYCGIRFKQTKKEKKLKKGGKWICFGAPYDAITPGQVMARQATQEFTLGGGTDPNGNKAQQSRHDVKRTRMTMNKGGVGPMDSWTSSGPWEDHDGFFSAAKKAMTNNALRITFLFEDDLDPYTGVKAFTPKGPVAATKSKRKEPEAEFTAEEVEKMEREKRTVGDLIVEMVKEQPKGPSEKK